MSNLVKRKPKVRHRASSKAIYAESPPHWTEKFLQKFGLRPPIDAGVASLRPTGHIADLRSRIEADAQLSKDFVFFVRKTGWSPEDFLWRLFWAKDVMHGNDPELYRKIKEETWPVARKRVETLLKNIRKVEKEIEQVNATDFSPAGSEILCDRTGKRLPPEAEQCLRDVFRYLPVLLAFYREELSRRLRVAAENWPQHKKSLSSIIDLTRQDSLYEQIRASAGKYHATRLHRLVNAAREAQDLRPIEWSAFRKWLNELKKEQERSQPQPAC